MLHQCLSINSILLHLYSGEISVKVTFQKVSQEVKKFHSFIISPQCRFLSIEEIQLRTTDMSPAHCAQLLLH